MSLSVSIAPLRKSLPVSELSINATSVRNALLNWHSDNITR